MLGLVPNVKSSESSFQWIVQSYYDNSSGSIGILILVIVEYNFLRFGTNYLAFSLSFFFIFTTKFTSNLSIFNKVCCVCERIAADDSAS